jgi:hypothetical protein
VRHSVHHPTNPVRVEDARFAGQLIAQIRASLWGRPAPVKERARGKPRRKAAKPG